MLTSAKQTFSIRGHLYFGLCFTLLLEIGLIKLGADDFDRQFWVMSKVFLVRMAFLGAATVQILHSIFTYRDYEVLNYGLLQTLVEKVRALEENAGGRAPSYASESEESLRDYSWVFDELADDVDSKMDPTYVVPPERSPPTRRRDQIVVAEETGENSVTTFVSRKYNLRARK
ncbi:Protein GAMETE EXPRESSED 1 [Zea mays]|nr:Protein GAMETE EXPRESSED 1 [Zea mays]